MPEIEAAGPDVRSADETQEIEFSESFSASSLVLDMVEDHPERHSLRSRSIGMTVGSRPGMSEEQLCGGHLRCAHSGQAGEYRGKKLR